jgi:hypothetical protein
LRTETYSFSWSHGFEPLDLPKQSDPLVAGRLRAEVHVLDHRADLLRLGSAARRRSASVGFARHHRLQSADLEQHVERRRDGGLV